MLVCQYFHFIFRKRIDNLANKCSFLKVLQILTTRTEELPKDNQRRLFVQLIIIAICYNIKLLILF